MNRTIPMKVSKGAKIRNRYNQVPHLTQDTNGKVTNSRLYHHFTKDCLGPESTRSLFWVNRPLFANNLELARTVLYIRGKIWSNCLSLPRVGLRKSGRLLFLNMFKNSSRSKQVGPGSSWSAESPLKILLSRLPSGAFV